MPIEDNDVPQGWGYDYKHTEYSLGIGEGMIGFAYKLDRYVLSYTGKDESGSPFTMCGISFYPEDGRIETDGDVNEILKFKDYMKSAQRLSSRFRTVLEVMIEAVESGTI